MKHKAKSINWLKALVREPVSVQFGHDNPPEIQAFIDQAKDNLYQAAIIYKERASGE